jgi:hypothetical protein
VSLGGITNLDYTVLLCSKMSVTRAFYRDVMKFPIETDLEKWVSFRVGAALLTLRPRGRSATTARHCPGRRRSSLPFVCRRLRSMPAMRNCLLGLS